MFAVGSTAGEVDLVSKRGNYGMCCCDQSITTTGRLIGHSKNQTGTKYVTLSTFLTCAVPDMCNYDRAHCLSTMNVSVTWQKEVSDGIANMFKEFVQHRFAYALIVKTVSRRTVAQSEVN